MVGVVVEDWTKSCANYGENKLTTNLVGDIPRNETMEGSQLHKEGLTPLHMCHVSFLDWLRQLEYPMWIAHPMWNRAPSKGKIFSKGTRLGTQRAQGVGTSGRALYLLLATDVPMAMAMAMMASSVVPFIPNILAISLKHHFRIYSYACQAKIAVIAESKLQSRNCKSYWNLKVFAS